MSEPTAIIEKPHQTRAFDDVIAAINAGHTRICVCAPTGAGKSLVMRRIAVWAAMRKWRAVLYTNKRFLIEQTIADFAKADIGHGVRAAGERADRDQLVQLSSIQTEVSRVLKQGKWPIHNAKIVLVDEGHLHGGETSIEIFRRHHEAGAILIFFTATPIDMAHLADILIIAGTNSELRACGMLVPAVVYGPDEPDLIAFAKQQAAAKAKAALRAIESDGVVDAATLKSTAKAMMTPMIFGRVLEWYRILNPLHKPTVLFGPGAGEAKYFAEEFRKHGIPAAHMDAKHVWINGKTYRADKDSRKAVRDGSMCGDIKVVTNRWVMKEGVDFPWIEHIILAAVIGELGSYIQMVGRGLRASPETGKTRCCIQDHGGNWWRHGSPNTDWEWQDLSFTGATYSQMRADELRAKKCKDCSAPLLNGPRCQSCGKVNTPNPTLCPKCKQVLAWTTCPCGFVSQPSTRSRTLVQTDGTLTERYGDLYKPRQTTVRPDTERLWIQSYYAGKNSGRTFRAAYAFFCVKHGYWPPRDLPLMPTRRVDWYRLISQVDRSSLVPAPPRKPKAPRPIGPGTKPSLPTLFG